MIDPIPRLKVGPMISILVFQRLSSCQTSAKGVQIWTFRLGVERWAKYLPVKKKLFFFLKTLEINQDEDDQQRSKHVRVK
jgi:hypothetical protein